MSDDQYVKAWDAAVDDYRDAGACDEAKEFVVLAHFYDGDLSVIEAGMDEAIRLRARIRELEAEVTQLKQDR